MKGPGNDGGRRTRFKEELVLSHLVLRSAELLMAWREHGGESLATDKEFVTRAGDVNTDTVRQRQRRIGIGASSVPTIGSDNCHNNIPRSVPNKQNVYNKS